MTSGKSPSGLNLLSYTLNVEGGKEQGHQAGRRETELVGNTQVRGDSLQILVAFVECELYLEVHLGEKEGEKGILYFAF